MQNQVRLRRHRVRTLEQLSSHGRGQRSHAHHERVDAEQPRPSAPVDAGIVAATATARVLPPIGTDGAPPVGSRCSGFWGHARKYATQAPRVSHFRPAIFRATLKSCRLSPRRCVHHADTAAAEIRHGQSVGAFVPRPAEVRPRSLDLSLHIARLMLSLALSRRYWHASDAQWSLLISAVPRQPTRP